MTHINKDKEVVFNSFVRHLDSKVVPRYLHPIQSSALDAAIGFWTELSYSDKKRLVSSARWNHYPYSCWKSASKKPYGEVVGHIVKDSIIFCPRDRDTLMRYSVGVFAVYAFDEAEACEKKAMSKRLLDSPDKRVKNRALEFSTHSALKGILNKALKSNDNIFISKVVSEIGIINCYKDLIPESLDFPSAVIPWWIREAISLASRKEVSHLDSGIDDCNNAMIVSILLKKMPIEKSLFYMNNSSKGSVVYRIISRKMDSI